MDKQQCCVQIDDILPSLEEIQHTFCADVVIRTYDILQGEKFDVTLDGGFGRGSRVFVVGIVNKGLIPQACLQRMRVQGRHTRNYNRPKQHPLQVTTGLQKSFVSVGGVYVCVLLKKTKTFVYINYSVCIDVCETK